MVGISKDNRKVRRVILDQPLKVVICSIGAHIRYELLTKNLSHSGFFLDFESPARFPFTSSSIMEIWVEIEDDTPLFFNGKLARIVHKNEMENDQAGPGIAIKIVQIDDKNKALLHKFIKRKHQEIEDKKENIA